jgi:hypothetical protein
MTWKNMEFKSKFHSKKILVITDIGDMDKAREWWEKFEQEAKFQKKLTNNLDFQ